MVTIVPERRLGYNTMASRPAMRLPPTPSSIVFCFFGVDTRDSLILLLESLGSMFCGFGLQRWRGVGDYFDSQAGGCYVNGKWKSEKSVNRAIAFWTCCFVSTPRWNVDECLWMRRRKIGPWRVKFWCMYVQYNTKILAKNRVQRLAPLCRQKQPTFPILIKLKNSVWVLCPPKRKLYKTRDIFFARVGR